MKILCVIPSYHPAFQFGGPVASVHNLNKALVRRGIDITVYTTNVGLEGKVLVDQEVDVDGVKVFYFSFSKLFEFVGPTGWQFSWAMTKSLKKNINNFDLIYLSAIWNYPTAIAVYYCRKNKKPYIVAPRGIFYPSTFNKKIWKKFPYYQLIIKKVLRSANAIHYTSRDEFIKSHLFLGLKNKSFIIPNGIDLSEFKNLPSKNNLRDQYPVIKNKKVILFLSRLDWKKVLDVLAGAYGILARKRDDVHLLIVGDGPKNFKNQVKEWFEKEGIINKITFTGMLVGKKKLEALSGSDLFVLPSYSENFGMAVVEAIAAGLPVVVSDGVGMYEEIKEFNAGVVVSCDKYQLADGINKIINNDEIAETLILNANKLLEERFELNKTADLTLKMFQEILAIANQ